MTTFTLACVQTHATADMAANLDRVASQVREARAQGADFVATPENVALMGRDASANQAQARPLDDHPAVARFSASMKTSYSSKAMPRRFRSALARTQ